MKHNIQPGNLRARDKTRTLLRRGIVSDAAPLAVFAARTFADAFGVDNRPEDLAAHLTSSYGVAQLTRELLDPNVVTLLAERQGTLLGYSQIRRKSPPPCVTHELPIEVQRFYVDRPAHGSGLAATLMLAAKDAAREFGGEHVWLSVWECNPRAIAFYTKMGFVDVGSTYFLVGADRQTDRVLVAKLT